jgi:phosphatidylethanolamine/phosphatidyl-N-methylethanolamine N-methyltransferase
MTKPFMHEVGGEPGEARTKRWLDKGVFLREFILSPTKTASVTPSSAWLAKQMAAPIPEKGHPVVVELGPGTGAFTSVIQQRLAGRGRHIAVELNARMANALARRYPRVEVLREDATSLPTLLHESGVAGADVIISGLPWLTFAGERPLLSAVGNSLTSTGVYTQFTYSWARWTELARRQFGNLQAEFEEVLVSRTIWQNVPPALIYVARRPRCESLP